MRLIPIAQNAVTLTSDSVALPAREPFRDVWDAEGSTRTIVDGGGARTTFTYDVPSHTAVQFPTGGRVTLAWCQSQMMADQPALSHFGTYVGIRSQSTPIAASRQSGDFLAHPESQRQLARVANGALPAPLMRRRWLEDVVQQATLQLLADLRRGKLNFEGHDPQLFAHWFRGASRHAVIHAIKFCLRASARSAGAASMTDPESRSSADPAEIAMFRELARLSGQEIDRIPNADLREVMRDLRDGRSTRESAQRLGISKSTADRMRKRGCRLIAESLGM